MQFLYPTSRQFPFDEVCEQVVRELEKRNWDVPGITVEFDGYGTGEQKFRLVRRVSGDDFCLYFSRAQGLLPGGRWNDTAAVNTLNIPKQELSVYDDESGPTYYRYVGRDWDHDREQFIHRGKVLSRLYNEPRICLKYQGTTSTDGLYHCQGQRSPLLVHTNDLDREYDAGRDDKTFFKTSQIMEEFTRYIENTILKKILAQPEASERIDMFPEPPREEVPSDLGPLFCFAEYRDAERIKEGQAAPSELAPSDRYGLIGSGNRLLCLGEGNGRKDFPKKAYDGFLWCGLSEVDAGTEMKSLSVPGYLHWSREDFVVRITLNCANDIYVADHVAYEKRREEIEATLGDRDRFTDKEVGEMSVERARTMIPLKDYKGDFSQPIILVNRELGFDEVEVVSGPHR